MRFYKIIELEFRKLLKKPLSYVIFAVWFVPIFYTWSVMTNAPLLQMTPSGALDFAFGQWSLLGMTGLFQVLFSLITVNTFSAEIDKGQIKMTVLRQCTRKKLVYAKMIALLLYMLVCYFLFIAFSLLCYYCFVVHTPYGTGEFVSEAILEYGIFKFMVSGLFPLIETMITAGIIFIFSLRYKTGICFMHGIGITTVLLILQFFPIVQYLVPAYVGNLLHYGMITPVTALGLSVLYLITVIICTEVTARKFERMDLK